MWRAPNQHFVFFHFVQNKQDPFLVKTHSSLRDTGFLLQLCLEGTGTLAAQSQQLFAPSSQHPWTPKASSAAPAASSATPQDDLVPLSDLPGLGVTINRQINLERHASYICLSVSCISYISYDVTVKKLGHQNPEREHLRN
jgi:hypothetical protein